MLAGNTVGVTSCTSGKAVERALVATTLATVLLQGNTLSTGIDLADEEIIHAFLMQN